MKNTAPMQFTIGPYQDKDWNDLCDVHDYARLDELRGSVDLAAFLPLTDTAANEGLFDGEVWAASTADQVIGFVAVADDEITWLYVYPTMYRQGVEPLLLRHAVQRCGPTVTTEALVNNTPAIKLYLREGFEMVETRSGKLAGNEQFAATGVKLVLQK